MTPIRRIKEFAYFALKSIQILIIEFFFSEYKWNSTRLKDLSYTPTIEVKL